MAINDEHARILVIGVGNRHRADDGVGPQVADRIRSRVWSGVEVIEHSGEGASLMEAWQSGDFVILVDAARSGGEPGVIYEFDAHERPVPTEFFCYSTHAFSVAEAIELARALDRLPAHLHVYAIEGQDFEAGHAMTGEVARSAGIVSDMIVAHLVERMNDEIEHGPCTNSAS